MKNIKDKKSVAIKNSLYESELANHPAFKMVESGNVDKLKELSSDVLKEEVDNLGNTLLHKAVRQENTALIQAVLKMNIDVNAKIQWVKRRCIRLPNLIMCRQLKNCCSIKLM